MCSCKMFAALATHHFRCSTLIPLECRYRFQQCELSQIQYWNLKSLFVFYINMCSWYILLGCRVIAKDHNLEGKLKSKGDKKKKKSPKGSEKNGSGKSHPSSSKGTNGSKKFKGTPSKKGKVPRKSKTSQRAAAADDQPDAPATTGGRKKFRKAWVLMLDSMVGFVRSLCSQKKIYNIIIQRSSAIVLFNLAMDPTFLGAAKFRGSEWPCDEHMD